MNNTLDRKISWNTKFYIILAVLMAIFAFIFKDKEGGYFLGAVMAIICVLILDLYLILSKRYSNTWRWMKIVIIALILALTLISMTN